MIRIISKLELNGQTYRVGEISKTELGQVKDIADEALDKTSNAIPRYRTQGKPLTDGWYRIAKFTGASAISFSVAMADKYQAIAPTEINFSVAVRQMPADILKYDVDFLQDAYSGQTKIDSVRIVANNDFLALDFNYVLASTNTDDICVEIFNCSNNTKGLFDVEMTFEKVENEPELHYDYTFVNGGGRIANIALKDTNNNKIISKFFETKFSGAQTGYYRVADITYGVQFILSIFKFFNNSTECLASALVSVGFGNNITVSQLSSNVGGSYEIEGFRIVSDTNELLSAKHLDIYYHSSVVNEVQVGITVLSQMDGRTITVSKYFTAEFNPTVTDTSVLTNFNFDRNYGGIIASKAIFDGAGNNIAETYAKKKEMILRQVDDIYTISSEQELDSAVIALWNKVPEKASFEAVIESTNQESTLTGGTWYVSGFKGRTDNGFMTAKRYNGNNIAEFYKVENNGVFTPWIQKT